MHKLGLKGTEDMKGIIAVSDEGEPEAGCILNNWTYNAVFCHMWIDNPMVIKHGFFKEIGNYVFNICEKNVMIGMVPSDNDEALRLNKHIGFRETHRIKDGHSIGIDYVVMEGNRQDFSKWVPAKLKEVV
jgi:hypothetical protein